MKQSALPLRRYVGSGRGKMIDTKSRELEIQRARYRHLVRQVTDPLAEHLLKIIVIDLEGGLNSMLPDRPVKLPVHLTEERGDRSLVGCDRVEIAHFQVSGGKWVGRCANCSSVAV